MLYEDFLCWSFVCMYELGSRSRPPDRCYTHFALLPDHVSLLTLSLSSTARSYYYNKSFRAGRGSMCRKWREEARSSE